MMIGTNKIIPIFCNRPVRSVYSTTIEVMEAGDHAGAEQKSVSCDRDLGVTGRMAHNVVNPRVEERLASEQRDVRRIDDQQSARLKHAPMISQRAPRRNQLFDRAAGMDDVEAGIGKADILDGCRDQRGSRESGVSNADAFVRFDAGQKRVGRCG